ncbi:MAG TPA: hypothetical protein PKA58_30985, partial [Polyangium sp.]|nr:hypothetical protein [Polyangium sp.]
MRVYELAQNLGRTEEQMLDNLDAIGFTARDGQVEVPPNIVMLLIMRERHGSSSPPNQSDALVTAPAEWAILQGPDEAHRAVIVRYSSEESPRILANLTERELLKGGVPHAGNLSTVIVDHLVKAVPLVAAGLEAGQVFKVVGTPALVEGLANGSLSLMSTTGGSLGTVVSNASGRITGQLRFAQASAAPILAPVLAFQVFHALAGTMQLNRINTRLDTMQRSLERIAIRHEAEVLGKANQAIRMLEDLLQERQNTGTFSPDILTRLALVEKTIGSIVERNRILVDQLKQRINALRQTSGKIGAAQVSAFASEEWAQAIHDMR